MSGAAQPKPVGRRPGSASFLARVVEAAGSAWLPAEDDVSDPGVALDVARSLEPRTGPTVLRVIARGDEYRRVAGDWLCDDEPFSGKSRNARVGPLVWSASSEAGHWARGMPLIDAWEACERPSWMAQAAADAGVRPREVVLAALAVFERHGARDVTEQCDTNARLAMRLLGEWKIGAGDAGALYAIGSLLFREANSGGDATATSMSVQALTDLCLATVSHDPMPVAYAGASMRALSGAYRAQDLARSFREAMPSIVVLRAAVRRGLKRRRGP